MLYLQNYDDYAGKSRTCSLWKTWSSPFISLPPLSRDLGREKQIAKGGNISVLRMKLESHLFLQNMSSKRFERYATLHLVKTLKKETFVCIEVKKFKEKSGLFIFLCPLLTICFLWGCKFSSFEKYLYCKISRHK